MKKTILLSIIISCSVNVFGQKNKEEIVTTKGFYIFGWEQSFFYEIKDSSLYFGGWLEFGDSFEVSDSLKKIKNAIPEMVSVYIKFDAIKRTGGHFGHLGGADTEFEVIRLLDIDPTYSISNFLENTKSSPVILNR